VNPITIPDLIPQQIVADPILGGDDGALCAGGKPFGKCMLKASATSSQPPTMGLCLPDMEEAILKCSPDDVRSITTDDKIRRFQACDGKEPGDGCNVLKTSGMCKAEVAHFRPVISHESIMKRSLAIVMCEFPQVDPIPPSVVDPIAEPTPAVNPPPVEPTPGVKPIVEPPPIEPTPGVKPIVEPPPVKPTPAVNPIHPPSVEPTPAVNPTPPVEPTPAVNPMKGNGTDNTTTAFPA